MECKNRRVFCIDTYKVQKCTGQTAIPDNDVYCNNFTHDVQALGVDSALIYKQELSGCQRIEV